MREITGWRLDAVRPDGCVGWYGAPDSPGHDRTGEYRAAADRYLYTPRAVCLLDRHHFYGVPAEGCECGWRLVTDANELHPHAHGNARSRGTWAWRERGVLASAGVGVGPDGRVGRELIAKRGAIVEVASVGRVVAIDDTTSSYAAARLERLHVHVIENRTGMPLARAVRRFYGTDAVSVHVDVDACLRSIGASAEWIRA